MTPPFRRACDSCRALKTRCLLDNEEEGTCQRCIRFKRKCHFTPVSQRNRRKRTDTRVAELEEQFARLQQRIHDSKRQVDLSASEGAVASPYTPDCNSSGASTTSQFQGSRIPFTSSVPMPDLPRSGYTTSPSDLQTTNHTFDPVQSGLMTLDSAEGLLRTFKTEMYCHYPIVYLPQTCGAEDLRRDKPSLFLAILAAAAGKEFPKLALQLDHKVMQHYADRVVLESEKSLELVQSLLVSSTWYQPPTRLNQFKYTDYAYLAGNMAIDIGIGSRPLDGDGSSWTASFESMRTFAAILAKSAGVAMTGRKASAIRLGSWGRECLLRLEDIQNRDAAPGDVVLAAWTRLLYVSDDILSAFSYDDPGAVASVRDVTTQVMMKAFEQRLLTWRDSYFVFDGSPSLRIQFYATRIYLREVILYADHRPEDFKVPYRMSPMVVSKTAGDLPVKFVVDSLADLIEASHKLLDSFMSIDAYRTRALPLGMFVRVSYACFILAKLCISAASAQSQLRHFLDSSQIQADSYLKHVLLHVRSSIGSNGSRLPSIFLNLLAEMQEWCLHPDIAQNIDKTGNDSNEDNDYQSSHAVTNSNVSQVSCGPSHSAGDNEPLPSKRPCVTFMTGAPASNFEQFGNSQAVDLAARHGLLGEGIEIEDTLALVKSTLLGASSGPRMEFDPASDMENPLVQKKPCAVSDPLSSFEFDVCAELDDMEYVAQMHHIHCVDDELPTEQVELSIFDEIPWPDARS